jgi:hypothetical protein
MSEKEIGTCEWCKKEDVVLRPIKDIDEGFSTGYYKVCNECRKKEVENYYKELEEN